MAQTRRTGMQKERARLPKAPRPPSQATARPNREDVHISECGRDEAFRVVGFSPCHSLVAPDDGRLPVGRLVDPA
jgi:hypothetical protein